jgi:hypothetical protein
MMQISSEGTASAYHSIAGSIECTVAVSKSFSPYDQLATLPEEEALDGWSVVRGVAASVKFDTVQFPNLVIGVADASYERDDMCIDFRIHCAFTESAAIIPLLYWPPSPEARVANGNTCPSAKQPLRIVLTEFPTSASISVPIEKDFVITMEKQIYDIATGDRIWVPMKEDDQSVCEANVDIAQETTGSVAGAEASIRQKAQVGTGIAGRSKIRMSRGVARFDNLVFTKVDAVSVDAGAAGAAVEFQGVGDRLWVNFKCEGAEVLDVVLANVSISGCDSGQEPSTSRDRCLACAPTHVQAADLTHMVHEVGTVVKIEKCQPCCGVDKTINTTDAASSSCTGPPVANGARTSCECPAGYLAVNNEPRLAAKLSWPRICMKCPLGGDCSSPGTTFESVRAKPGWWQDKLFFASESRAGSGRPQQEQLSFVECQKAANGDSACNGGAYESAYGNGTGVGSCRNITHCKGGCRPNHRGFMCGICVDGYQKGLDNYCEECPESTGESLGAFYAVIAFVIFFGGVVVVVRTHFMGVLHVAEARALDKFERMVVAAGVETLEGVKRFEEEYSWENLDGHVGQRIGRKIKIFISFSQVVSSFTANFNSVAWPVGWREFTSYFNIVNLNPFSFRTLGCAVKITFPDVFFFSTLWPVFLCGLMYTAHRVALHFKRTPLQHVKYVYKFVIGVFFCTYPSVSNATFRMTNCLEFADGSQWLESDLSIRCNEDPEKGWIAYDVLFLTYRIPMTYRTMRNWASFFIFIYPIGFPLASYLTLWWHKEELFLKRLSVGQFVETELGSARVRRCLPDDTYDLVYEEDGELGDAIHISKLTPQIGSISEYVNYRGHFCMPNPDLVTKLGYLFDSYEPEYWYWEVLEMIPRLFLTGLIVFVVPQVPNQMACGCLLSMVMILAISKSQPFTSDEDDTLQLLCFVAIFAGFFAGFMLCFKEAEGVSGYDLGDGSLLGLLIILTTAIPLCIGLVMIMTALCRPCGSFAYRAYKNRQAFKNGEENGDVSMVKGLGGKTMSMADLKAAMMEGMENPMMERVAEEDEAGDEGYDDFASVAGGDGPNAGGLFRPTSRREMQWQQKEQALRAGRRRTSAHNHMVGSLLSDKNSHLNHVHSPYLMGEGGGRARGNSVSGICIGAMVKMHGLRKAHEYNGQIGRVQVYQPGRHRWLVKAWGDGRAISLGPEHLTPITMDALARPSREAPRAPWKKAGNSTSASRTKKTLKSRASAFFMGQNKLPASNEAAAGSDGSEKHQRAPALNALAGEQQRWTNSERALGAIDKAVERSRRNLRAGQQKTGQNNERAPGASADEGMRASRGAHLQSYAGKGSKRIAKKFSARDKDAPPHRALGAIDKAVERSHRNLRAGRQDSERTPAEEEAGASRWTASESVAISPMHQVGARV